MEPPAPSIPDPPPQAAPARAEEPPAPGPSRPRRWRAVALATGFVVVALAAAGVLVALALAQESPRWWHPVNPADPAAIETARKVENGIATALTQVRLPEPPAPAEGPRAAPTGPAQPAPTDASWRVFITDEQANAWLTVRLQRWLSDQAEQGTISFRWPPEVSQVQASFEDGRIHLGARLTRRARPGQQPQTQTLAASLRPEFRADGSLWMTAERIEIGRLSLPAGWVLGSTRQAQQRVQEVSGELADLPQTERVVAAMRGERPVLLRPVIKLADGRRVRIVSMQPQEGRLVITCRTEDPARAER